MKPLFLIADDSQPKRDFLERFVRKNIDVEILTASSTEEAHKLILEHVEFAAAFIDYEIPSENGPAVIKHLKEHNPDCRVALVSSSDSSQYQAKAKEAGAEKYICTSWALERTETELNMLLAEWKAQIQS
jgi:DNA-binding NarL/FixJ family response regulator